MFLVRFLHRIIEGWRFVMVSGGISSSLMLSLFIFRVFAGVDIPLLRHIELTDEWMPWLGVICSAYYLLQQQSIAARPALDIGPVLADVLTSLTALTVLVIFGWLRWLLVQYEPTTFEIWALAMFSFITVADGIYNSFISIRYLPRYVDVERAHG